MNIKNDIQLLLLKSIVSDGPIILRRKIYGADLNDLVDEQYLAERVIDENKSEFKATDEGRRALKETLENQNWHPSFNHLRGNN